MTREGGEGPGLEERAEARRSRSREIDGTRVVPRAGAARPARQGASAGVGRSRGGATGLGQAEGQACGAQSETARGRDAGRRRRNERWTGVERSDSPNSRSSHLS